MKYYFKLILLVLISNICNSQTLPMYRYHKPKALDLIDTASSFAYSLRKIESSYTGFAIRIRRNSAGSPQADVAFDSTDVVSGNSIITITSAGDGLSVGQTMSLATFIDTNLVYVNIWYNQGDSAFDATQTSVGNQPRLVLNSAGILNNKPSILFTTGTPALTTAVTGGDFLVINQPIQNILDNGIRGTFLWALKPSSNIAHFAFGYKASTNWRWSFHVNWKDGRLYFDSAEACCAPNRSIANATNINLWKQYTIVRGTTYKTVRIGGATTGLNNSSAVSTSQSGGQFHIGSAFNNPNNTFSGYISELIMFPIDLSLTDITTIENNQIAYWDL
jgi:hypothetical protein